VSGEHAVAMYVAYYAPGQREAKLASWGDKLFTGDWLPVSDATRSIVVGGQSFDAHETMAQAPNTSLVVWNWYWVDGTFTRHDAVAKLLLAKSRLLRTGRGSAAIAVAAQDLPGSDVSLVLRDFVAHLNVDSHGSPSPRP
jgi:EpsI family protein